MANWLLPTQPPALKIARIRTVLRDSVREIDVVEAKYRETRRKWRAANKERIAALNRDWHQRNKERKRKYNLDYYYRNHAARRAYLNAKQREYRAAQKGQCA